MKTSTVVAAIVAFFVCADLLAQNPNTDIIIEDVHGRVLNGRSITLVDWDGFLANPAIRLYLRVPPTVGFPATATLSSSQPRLYFDLPSEFGASGPAKSIVASDASARYPFLLSIFPDRDGTDEDYALDITIQHLTLTMNVHVVDQDQNLAAPFHVTIDFTRDQTSFFGDAAKRALVAQALADWAYFIDDMDLDSVPAGAEMTFIWNPDGFNSGSWTTNTQPYTGFLLYAYGISSAELRSGGEPSLHAFQHSDGTALPLRRSGGIEIETKGNYNTLGWFLTASESDWWKATNLAHEANDLYSIVHHEAGHSLFFNPGHTQFPRSGSLSSAELTAYYGSALSTNASDHFHGAIDPTSRKGAFGYEYFGDVPRGRWLPTKLDLLALAAVGYELRDLSPLRELAIMASVDTQAPANSPFTATLVASGGVPAYDWSIAAGTLPPGLTLDRFTGVISGTPTASGTYACTVRVRDSDLHQGTATAAASIVVTAPLLPAPASVIAAALTATSVRISWSAVAGAAHYEVLRATSNNTFISRGTTTGTTLDDPLASDTAALYKVRAIDSGGIAGATSTADLATTVLFTNDPLTAGTKVKVVHVTELRRAVNAVRALAGLAPATFTDPSLAGARIRAVHWSELRTNLDAARAALSLPAIAWTGSPASGALIRTTHVADVRGGVQ